MFQHRLWSTVMLLALLPLLASAQQLTLADQFSTVGGIGLAFDAASDTVWTYGGDTFRQYSRTGSLLRTLLDAPGVTANDADLDFADVAFTLGTTDVPAGSLLFTNGEVDTAEIYAFGPSAIELGSLSTAFGNSHVVGAAYSPLRGTMFLLQDNVPAAAVGNVVAEIDAVTGAVLNSFDLDDVAPDFNVFFGDLEVSSNSGDLFLVSSTESTILQLSPTGTIIQELTIAPSSAGSLAGSGIALDDARNEIYVQTPGGVVYRFTEGGLTCDADADDDCMLDDIDAMYDAAGSPGMFDFDGDGVVDPGDIDGWLTAASSPANSVNPTGKTYKVGDLDLDGDLDSTDLGLLLNRFNESAGSPGTGPGWGGGDVTMDGTVNSTDLGQLLNNFGFEASVSAVPEPSGVEFLGLAIVAFAAIPVRRHIRATPRGRRIDINKTPTGGCQSGLRRRVHDSILKHSDAGIVVGENNKTLLPPWMFEYWAIRDALCFERSLLHQRIESSREHAGCPALRNRFP